MFIYLYFERLYNIKMTEIRETDEDTINEIKDNFNILEIEGDINRSSWQVNFHRLPEFEGIPNFDIHDKIYMLLFDKSPAETKQDMISAAVT
jgi:hypothetical protein